MKLAQIQEAKYTSGRRELQPTPAYQLYKRIAQEINNTATMFQAEAVRNRRVAHSKGSAELYVTYGEYKTDYEPRFGSGNTISEKYPIIYDEAVKAMKSFVSKYDIPHDEIKDDFRYVPVRVVYKIVDK